MSGTVGEQMHNPAVFLCTRKEEEVSNGKRQSEVVQQSEGLWFHHA